VALVEAAVAPGLGAEAVAVVESELVGAGFVFVAGVD